MQVTVAFEGTVEGHLALVEEPLVVLGLTGGAWVGLAQGDELADISVLVPLELGPVQRNRGRVFMIGWEEGANTVLRTDLGV